MPEHIYAMTRWRRPGRKARLWAAVALMLLFALVALVRPFGHAARPGLSAEGRVETVIDGDTVRLADGRHVRYIGIDSPEMDSPTDRRRSAARRALEFNRELVGGRHVRLEFDVELKDRYGRVLAYVWVGDRMANAEMVAAGLARARIYGANMKHADELARLESRAKAEGRGLWETPPTRTPAP